MISLQNTAFFEAIHQNATHCNSASYDVYVVVCVIHFSIAAVAGTAC